MFYSVSIAFLYLRNENYYYYVVPFTRALRSGIKDRGVAERGGSLRYAIHVLSQRAETRGAVRARPWNNVLYPGSRIQSVLTINK